MVWGDNAGEAAAGRDEQVELVGTNLRINGMITLGRFGRLTDMINASSGYVRVRDAHLLQRNGEPTGLQLSELMVDQDEISFMAQAHAGRPERGSPGGFLRPRFGAPVEARQAWEFVMFTPGHTVTGRVHVFGQTDLVGFVDTSDPRFVPVTGVTTRSLTDRRIVSRYDFILINRTQMIAVAEAAASPDPSTTDVAET